MSGYYKQLQNGAGAARRMLDERLARKEMGDDAYEKSRSQGDDRSFKIVGLVLMVVFGAAVLVVTSLGY